MAGVQQALGLAAYATTTASINAAGGMTTLREKALRLANNSISQGTPWQKPWMKSLAPWQPSKVYAQSNMVVSGGYIYVQDASGTSAATGGPTGVATSGVTDGTSQWIYYRKNNLTTTDPFVSQPAWAQSTSYVLGNQVLVGADLFACVAVGVYTFTVSGITVTPTAGAVYTNNGGTFQVLSASIVAGAGTVVGFGNTAPAASGNLTKVSGTGDSTVAFASKTSQTTSSGSGTGPTGTYGNNIIQDGGIVWTYMGPYIINPYAGRIPTVSFTNTAAISPYNSLFSTTNGQAALGIIYATPRSTGNGLYQVGDTITLTGGTGTAAVLKVLTLNGSGNPATVSIQTAGAYTTLSQTGPTYWAQASSSGSGTGETFICGTTEPGHLSIAGAMPNVSLGGIGNGQAMTFNSAINGTTVAQHWVEEFYSDSDIITISQGIASSNTLIIDGVMWSPDPTSGYATGLFYTVLDFTNAGGKKIRNFKIYHLGLDRTVALRVNVASNVWKPATTNRIKFAFISDSILAGSAYGPFVGGNSVVTQLDEYLGWSGGWSFTTGGTGYVARGTGPGTTTDAYGVRVPQVLCQNPDIIMLMGSTNDIGQSTGTITAAVTALLQSIRNGAGGYAGSRAPIVVFGLWSINNAGLAAVEAAVQAGVTAFNDPLGRTFFVPIYNDPYLPWLNGSWNNNPAPSGVVNVNASNQTTYLAGDSTHPVDMGTIYLAERLANALIQNVLPNLNC